MDARQKNIDELSAKLISAVDSGDLTKLQLLISENPGFDFTQKLPGLRVENLLFHALTQRKEDIAIFLIDTGKFKLIPTENFCTNRNVVHVAAEARCNNVLRHLLSIEGLDTMQSGLFGWSLLHFAAFGGDTTTVTLVLDTGKFDINCLDTLGKNETPLHAAAPRAKKELIQFLIGRGAHVNATTSPSHHQETPIRCAIRNQNFEGVDALLENNAKYFSRYTEQLVTQLSFCLEPVLDEICDVSDPNDALRILNEITSNLQLRSQYELSLEDAIRRNNYCKSQDGHDSDFYLRQISTIETDFQLFRYDKKAIYQLRQILREDERSFWVFENDFPNYDNHNQPSIAKSQSAFVSLKKMMGNFYPDLQAGDIAVATYKLILDRKKQLEEKLSLVASQADELNQLKEEVSELKKQIKLDHAKEVKDVSQESDQRYIVSNAALLALHKERLARQERKSQNPNGVQNKRGASL